MTGCSQPTAPSACHGLMIIPGTWQPQPGTWHNQPITQIPTWDCHWFSCQPEIRSCGGKRSRAPGAQGWEQPMPRPLLMSLQVPSNPLTLCCFLLKSLNRRSSRWRVAQVCIPTLLIPYTICVPFKAAGGGGCQHRELPSHLASHSIFRHRQPFSRSMLGSKTLKGLGDNRQDLPN